MFPEILRSEYHGIRAVVEAHAGKGKIHKPEEGSANGLAMIGARIRVKMKDSAVSIQYTIDRWD